MAGVFAVLLGNLQQLLLGEVYLVYAMKDRITSLVGELEMIHVFLKDSNERLDEDEMTNLIISQIRDLAIDAQDAVDTLLAYAAKHKRRNRNRAWDVLDISHRFVMMHRFSSMWETIRNNLEQITRNRHRYSIEAISESTTRRGHRPAGAVAKELLHRRRRDVETEKVVGFDTYSAQVIKLLLEGENSSLRLVCITGMAGLGKTTLARKVYNDDQVKRYFHRFAWVHMSNHYRVEHLLLNLMICLTSDEEAIQIAKSQDVDHLWKMLLEQLKDKRYLVVLDDVWFLPLSLGERNLLPDDHNGSRVLITSRRKTVAFYSSLNPSLHYRLQFLNQEDSWKLFCNVCWGTKCPSGLEPLGRRIVESCNGLPLSIVALAELLQRKEKSEREWSRFVGNVNWYFTHNETLVKDIIKLSYNDLPLGLKNCFLYLGLFPQDRDIPFWQLAHLWAAEGFVEASWSSKPEDVAADYLEKLHNHSLIQMGMIRSDGRVKTVRNNDLIRNFCISEGKKNKLLEVCTDDNMIIEGTSSTISLQCNAHLYMSSSPCDHSRVRSVLCFGQPYNFGKSHWKWILKRFRLLRALDLGKVQGMSSIPEKLEKLIHLRYLRIDTGGSSLNIDAVCNLWNLETLDLRNSRINCLPKGIRKLEQLRHLYMYGDVTLPNGKIASNLETLSTIALHPKNVSQLEKVAFPKLRKLGFSCSHDESNLELLQRLQCLNDLHTLKIINVSGFATSGNGFPPNLITISLVNITNFGESCMRTLGSLPGLKILKLSEMQDSSNLHCAGDFQQLEVFQMKRLSCRKWELAQGSMPRLRRFVLKNCGNMTSLPDELWSLSDLREVVVMWPTNSMVDGLQKMKTNGRYRITLYPPAGEETCIS